MNATAKDKAKEFLFTDEKIKYSFSHADNQLTIHCDHPIFVNRFGSDTVTLTLEDFLKTSPKGSSDYNFFEKFKMSLQEHFIDYDA